VGESVVAGIKITGTRGWGLGAREEENPHLMPILGIQRLGCFGSRAFSALRGISFGLQSERGLRLMNVRLHPYASASLRGHSGA